MMGGNQGRGEIGKVLRKLWLVIDCLNHRWAEWKGKSSRTYTSFWLDKPFYVETGLRKRVLNFLESGNILRAVRLLYQRGYEKREIRHFLEVEMNIPWHSTVPLDEWNPALADNQQLLIVKRIEASAQVMAELNDRVQAGKRE